MDNVCLLIDRLRQEVTCGKITYDDIMKRLSVAIEKEYLKDTPNMEFINVCEDFLWEMGTQGQQKYVSANEQYLKAIQQYAKGVTRSDNSLGIERRFAVVLAVIAFLIFFTQGILRFNWFTQKSSSDGYQYIIQGHEITLSLIQECIAEHDAYSELKTSSWDELCEYLGFAPSVISPEAFQVDKVLYQVYVEPDIVMINALYESEPGNAIAVLTIQYYADMDEALFMFEQDANGEQILVNGHSIYTSTNVERISYSWMSDSTVMKLAGTFDYDQGLSLVNYLTKGDLQ